MEAEAFGGKLECKESRVGLNGISLATDNKYTNTNNEKDNIVIAVFMYKYISRITILPAAGIAG